LSERATEHEPAIVGPALAGGLALAAALATMVAIGPAGWRPLLDLWRLALAGTPTSPSAALGLAGTALAAAAAPSALAALAALLACALANRRLCPEARGRPSAGPAAPAWMAVVGIAVVLPAVSLLKELLVAVYARPGAALDGLLEATVWTSAIAAAALVLAGAVAAGSRLADPGRARGRGGRSDRPVGRRALLRMREALDSRRGVTGGGAPRGG